MVVKFWSGLSISIISQIFSPENTLFCENLAGEKYPWSIWIRQIRYNYFYLLYWIILINLKKSPDIADIIPPLLHIKRYLYVSSLWILNAWHTEYLDWMPIGCKYIDPAWLSGFKMVKYSFRYLKNIGIQNYKSQDTLLENSFPFQNKDKHKFE